MKLLPSFDGEGLGSGARIVWIATADTTKVTASTISAMGALNARISTPAMPGPDTSAAERPNSSLLLASTRSSRPIRDGSMDLLATLKSILRIPTDRATTYRCQM